MGLGRGVQAGYSMNILEHSVTKILSQPYRQFGRWWVDVEYTCWGSAGKSNLMFDTEAAAKAVGVGHTFQA